ncbi:MAG: hypothetical protein IKY70_07705 [Bacteroidales bacterium]|nr:hypothetical protein [Bacteroidales bacterium]
MRVAVLDLGTNVFNMLLADFTREGCRYVKEFKCAAKLGGGGLSSGVIAASAFDTACAAMERIMEQIELNGGADYIIPYATSAVRDAANGNEFVALMREKFGVEVRVIPGEREAEFIFKGIIRSLPEGVFAASENGAIPGQRKNILMLDIGGGSNEFIISDGKEILWKESFPIGMARMREKFNYEEPIANSVIEEFEQFCNGVLEPLWEQIEIYRPQLFVGSSGSFDTFKDLMFGPEVEYKPCRVLPADDLLALHEKLLLSTAQERLAMPRMSPIRVDYIVLASVFTQMVLRRVQPEVIYQSAYSLKEGAMAEHYENWLDS